MSFLDKLQVAARKVRPLLTDRTTPAELDPIPQAGTQASAFGKDVAQFAGEGGRQIQTGFKLEGECQKAAKILQSFVADPDHPESALNSIPKAVLQRAKGEPVSFVFRTSRR